MGVEVLWNVLGAQRPSLVRFLQGRVLLGHIFNTIVPTVVAGERARSRQVYWNHGGRTVHDWKYVNISNYISDLAFAIFLCGEAVVLFMLSTEVSVTR